MKPLLLIAIVLFTAPFASCKSTKSADDVPCRCGTEMGDLEGCANSICSAGKTNTDNPLCVCGKIEVPESKNK